MSIEIDDLIPFDPFPTGEVARYQPINGEADMKLRAARPEHEFSDNYEVYTKMGVIALCPTAEWAKLICDVLNCMYLMQFDFPDPEID